MICQPRLKLLDVDVASFGEPIGDAGCHHRRNDDSSRWNQDTLAADRRIVGALGVGHWPEAGSHTIGHIRAQTAMELAAAAVRKDGQSVARLRTMTT